MKNKIWKVKCRKCGEFIYYYPSKLLLESKEIHISNMDKRIISLTCCVCEEKQTLDYEFPKEFIT